MFYNNFSVKNNTMLLLLSMMGFPIHNKVLYFSDM